MLRPKCPQTERARPKCPVTETAQSETAWPKRPDPIVLTESARLKSRVPAYICCEIISVDDIASAEVVRYNRRIWMLGYI